jgi:hypothetical protein
MKMDLLTNTTVVEDAIRFVSQKSKSDIESSNNGSRDDERESNEPHYDEDHDQLEEEQEGETGEINEATINQVF